MARAKKAAPPAEEIDAPAPYATDAQPAVIASAVELIPLGRLRRAPENVRKTAIDVDVTGLADDIAAKGVLQNLIGYAGDTDIDRAVVYIVGGGRRLQALDLLRQGGRIDDAFAVPVLLRPAAEAVELSLSENLQKRDMNPADEFEAFAALMKPGTLSPGDLARRFGFSERYVKQRLRLADLAPEILDTMRAGELTIDSAMAYASTTDRALQLKVFKAQMRPNVWRRHSPLEVRAAIAADSLTEGSAVFQFIDRATYEAEGGGYQEDLFSEAEGVGEGNRKLTHGQLARDIASRCLHFQADRVLHAAQAEMPGVCNFVIPSDLVLGGTVTGPSGFVKVEGGWNSNLGQHVSIEECWKRAVSNSILIHVEIGIGVEEPLEDGTDDGSPLAYIAKMGRARFWVPKDAAGKVLPPRHVTNYGGQPLTPEQQRAAQIEREARVIAARLSVPKFSSLPEFEGRAYYDQDYLDTHRVRPGDPVSGPRTPSFTVRIFVTEDEIAAHLEEGQRLAVEAIEAREAAKAKAAADREEAAERREKERADTMAAIAAMDGDPAVILVAEYADDDLAPAFLQDDGSYVLGDPEAGEDGEAYADIEFLLECVAHVAGAWASVAAWEAWAAQDDAAPTSSDNEVEAVQ